MTINTNSTVINTSYIESNIEGLNLFVKADRFPSNFSFETKLISHHNKSSDIFKVWHQMMKPNVTKKIMTTSKKIVSKSLSTSQDSPVERFLEVNEKFFCSTWRHCVNFDYWHFHSYLLQKIFCYKIQQFTMHIIKMATLWQVTSGNSSNGILLDKWQFFYECIVQGFGSSRTFLLPLQLRIKLVASEFALAFSFFLQNASASTKS